MKKITFITAIVLFAYLIFDVSIHQISTNRAMHETSQDEYSTKYILKEYNGKLAVFENEDEKPYRITELSLNILPEYDKKLLQNGIEVNTVQELNKVLEDYLS